MDKGAKFILCIIAINLIMIAECGVPLKLQKLDLILYPIEFITLLIMSGYFKG